MELDEYNCTLIDLLKNPKSEYEEKVGKIRYRYLKDMEIQRYNDFTDNWEKTNLTLKELAENDFKLVKDSRKTYNTAEAIQMIYDGEIMKSCIDYIYKISGSCILGKKYGEIDDWSEQGFNISELNGRWTEI